MYSRPLTSYSLDPEPRLTMNARSSGNRDDPRTPPGSARAAVSSMRISSSVRERSMACLPPGALTRPLVAPAYRLPRARASPMARSAEVLERRARATYTGATREPEGGMRELVFALEFRGSAGPVPGVDGRRRARTSATSQVLRTLLRAGDVQATVEPTGEGVAILESEVLSTGGGTFVESGTISYGDGHGAVIWEVTRAEGRLAGAQGFITSNFTVGPDGQVTDNHFARLFLP